MTPTTRRRFLVRGGLSAAAAAGIGAAVAAGRNEAAPARRAAPGKGASDRPNVVLIIVDTLRADHVYGDRARTPNMDALARQGVSFTNCFPEAMPTVPARRSLLSGRRAWPFRGWHPWPGLLDEPGWAPLHDPAHSLTGALGTAGYWTGYVTDNTFLGFSRSWAPYRASVDRFVRRGGQLGGASGGVSETELSHWVPPPLDDPDNRNRIRRYLANGRYWNDDSRSFAARVFTSAADLLEAASRRREPFALVVDTFEPHEPWTPPRRFVDMYGDPDYHGPEPARPYYAPVSRYLSGPDLVLVDRMKALYAGEVTMTDHWLGVFLDRLHELRLDESTVIALVADHGFFLGDHGLTGKLPTRLHPELIHVPLMVIHPDGRRAGATEEAFASTHDVAPTLLAMCGVPAPESMDGHDLSGVFHDRPQSPREFAWGGYGNCFFVSDGEWKAFGTNRGEQIRLYNPRRDPRELHDVAAAHGGTAERLFETAERLGGGRLPVFTKA